MSRAARPTRATMADIAREAGLSRTTVSYVLNRVTTESIPAPTADRVFAAAKKLGYSYNAPARALRRGKSDIVLALFPTFTMGYVFEAAMEVLTESLAERGYTLLLHRYNQDPDAAERLWRSVMPAAVVGVAKLPLELESSIRSSGVSFADLSTLVSHRDHGRAQAGYLLTKGYRSLAFLGSSSPDLAAFNNDQFEGVCAAASAAGIPKPVRAAADPQLDAILPVVERWHEQRGSGVAICAHNDTFALLVWEALTRLGLRPRDDVAVIGSDDIPLADMGITTLAVSPHGIAERLLRGILGDLDDDAEAPPATTPVLSIVERLSA